MDDSSFLSLNPSEPVGTSGTTTVMFPPQPVPKSPLIAFLLSLVCPGAGQMYCGKTSRGFWTLGVFLPVLAVTTYFTRQMGGPEGKLDALWGVALRMALFLYIFAFLDAFFTAREMTVGTDAFIAENPRVAAILNLLTRGFGYFYLGERKLGLGVFFGLMFFQRALVTTPGGEVLLEIISAVMAAHAYSIARRTEVDILATLQMPAERPSMGLPRAIPIGLALVLTAGYIALLGMGLSMPDYSHVDQASARVSQDSQGVLYQNPAYEVSLLVPSSWTVSHDEPAFIFVAIRRDHACSATLQPLPWSLLISLNAFKEQLSYQFSHRTGLTGRVVDEQPAVLSSRPARDIRVSMVQGTSLLSEHHVITRRGLTLYDLNTDELADGEGNMADPSCSSDLRFIRENLALPR